MGAYLAFPHPPSPIGLPSFQSELEQTAAQAPMIPGALSGAIVNQPGSRNAQWPLQIE